ncbi:hypothetical protein D1641_06695 [Colidextribacter sp. OB.20]|uniref:DUF6948 domain-containing protein n=1 Tax=Colidextribacter sp. OB.20 TaxID=2304568 RepID=UPI001368207E|nr:hypothetical protein [Colidextribacter sp. OB.20]NBI09703.1 hypothetical protein [Colidextribacter sp. OB.20]
MEQKINEIEINGVTYIPKDSVVQMAPKLASMKYCMVRTYSAGVFAGYIESRDGKEVVLRNARRIWKWAGAASLSQLATDGTSSPNDCKFPVSVDRVTLLEVIEIIPITKKAKESIEGVPVWKV